MGSPVEYLSRCNEKFSSIIKSTSVSLLLTTLIFLSASSAPSEEPRRCYWCGPLAEQVHRSRRARPCSASLQDTICEAPHHHCATVATAPPYTESRLCVKMYQDECYPVYCNTTRTYKMTCPCRGDFCNGPNTPREEAAFNQLRQLTASGKIKRSIQEKAHNTMTTTHDPVNNIDEPTSERSSLAPDYSDFNFGTVTTKHDSEYESISTLNNSERGDESDSNQVNSKITHNAIVNEGDSTNETNKNIHETTTLAETLSQTGNSLTASIQSTVALITVTQTPSIEQSSTKSNEMSIDNKYDKAPDGDDTHINNEIPNYHALPSTETHYSLTSSEKPKLEVPTINKDTYEDSVGDREASFTIPVETVNELYPSVTSNKPTDLKETTESQESNVITETTKHDLKQFNEEQRHDTSDIPQDEISITRVADNETNLINAHSIEILDQKMETTTGEVDTNFNDTCNQTNTCNINGAHNKISQKTDSEVSQNPTATHPTNKISKPTEQIIHSNEDTNLGTTRPTLTTAVNVEKPADVMTTASASLSSKVTQTTESTSTSSIKMSKQTKERNNAFTVNGKAVMLVNAFLVVLAL